jgi:hypothetical protein
VIWRTTRGNLNRQRQGRNILGHHCARADDAASSDANAGKDDRASAQPAIFFDGTSLNLNRLAIAYPDLKTSYARRRIAPVNHPRPPEEA